MSIVKRGITIALLGPPAVYAVASPIGLPVIIWFVTLLGMIEFTAVKRHLKVNLLDFDKTSRFAFDKSHEFKMPIAKTNMFILCKCLACSSIAYFATWGFQWFVMGNAAYFIFWIFFTLVNQQKQESKVSTFLQNLSRFVGQGESSRTPRTRSIDEQFVLLEMDIISSRYQTDLMLSFALEYFGCTWIMGLCYAIPLYNLHPVMGPVMTVSLLISNWFNDAFALIVGRSLGKGRTTPLYPSISPNKSLEGAVGGTLANAIAFALFMFLFSPEGFWTSAPSFILGEGDIAIQTGLAFVYGLCLGILGVLGDLLQSLLKRAANVKDTGFVIRGHGGILDRLDGLLVIYPFGYWTFWFYLEYVKYYTQDV